jgi:uncharacterized SAM-binding protein YcdF (DUF218 family)
VENARFTASISREKGFKNLILVTSGYHMPRSVLIFKRAGLNVIPYPTDYKTNATGYWDVFSFLPNSYAFNINCMAFKEYLGILAIKAGVQ